MMKIPPPPAWIVWAIVVTSFVLVMLNGLPVRGADCPSYWFELTAQLDRQSDRIGNKADQQFIRKMINELTANDDAEPTPDQARWLLSIKTELERRK